jgi:hypothetical protein
MTYKSDSSGVDRETRNADIKLSLAIRKLLSRVTKGGKGRINDPLSTVSYLFALSGSDRFEWQTLHGYMSVHGSKEP